MVRFASSVRLVAAGSCPWPMSAADEHAAPKVALELTSRIDHIERSDDDEKRL